MAVMSVPVLYTVGAFVLFIGGLGLGVLIALFIDRRERRRVVPEDALARDAEAGLVPLDRAPSLQRLSMVKAVESPVESHESKLVVSDPESSRMQLDSDSQTTTTTSSADSPISRLVPNRPRKISELLSMRSDRDNLRAVRKLPSPPRLDSPSSTLRQSSVTERRSSVGQV
ncbi:hypothetical protein HMN09_01418800 [Mycena chlorophos]|uniref:Uncharacterized protein n=1 Tax=Mycena chlorophos TaxID=658473 RepID=A0A8H6VNV4_MYCCL|nr:hypothetical protein HMN09_01418800 [Mycena chlorophos]